MRTQRTIHVQAAKRTKDGLTQLPKQRGAARPTQAIAVAAQHTNRCLRGDGLAPLLDALARTMLRRLQEPSHRTAADVPAGGADGGEVSSRDRAPPATLVRGPPTPDWDRYSQRPEVARSLDFGDDHDLYPRLPLLRGGRSPLDPRVS
jgi:hypothetical protein